MNQPPPVKVFVEGRYRKLSRDLPQTVFWCPECKGHPRRRRKCAHCDGYGKLTRDSVQELVGWVLGRAFGTRKHKFHGAGREDMDVRMLGRGRPFVLELVGPRNTDGDLAQCERLINERNADRLEVLGLHWTEKARIRVLKETPYAKRYRALVAIEGQLDPALLNALLRRRIQVAQQTPERVLHRRADKVRERWMEVESIEPTDDGRHVVVVKTEHGTYVKEAISGEGQRTRPCLGELLGGLRCTCAELDVLAILDEQGEKQAVPEQVQRPIGFGTGGS